MGLGLAAVVMAGSVADRHEAAPGPVLWGREPEPARHLSLLPREGARPSALAEGWISKQAVSKRIQEMAAAGLVSIEPDPDDRRATIVRRTTEGDRVRSLAHAAIADIEATLAGEVGAERYRVFREVLDELAARD